jgi:hypothetical protein
LEEQDREASSLLHLEEECARHNISV